MLGHSPLAIRIEPPRQELTIRWVAEDDIGHARFQVEFEILHVRADNGDPFFHVI